MRLTAALFFSLMCVGIGFSSFALADPYLGFVTVPGSFEHDDFGPDPRIIGEVLKHSAATCVRAAGEEAAHVPLLGRPGIGYAYGGMSASEVQWYNNLGYYYFIFENEPDGTAGTNPNWAVDYMNRLNATYPVIKGVSPTNQVIGGNLFTFNYDTLYDYGLKTSSDQIGWHCYSNDPATGIAIENVKPVRDTMVARGDGAKKIFLGEGWGPMRELPGLPRLFPDAEITPKEIQILRNFVINGYWNIVTPKANYDPNWIWGVLFFTLNDNWGSRHWAERAVPHYDVNGNLIYYTVDGYNVGLDIFPHFFNGGLIDVNGNAKDNLMDLFPGKGLALGNSGMEYFDRSTDENVAADWTPRTNTTSQAYGLDASICHGGRRSQRLTLNGSPQEYISQDSVRAAVSPGLTYSATGWVKTFEVDKGSGQGAAIKLEFLDSTGATAGLPIWSGSLEGTVGWTKLTATGVAPANASKLRVTCELSGVSGRAWFDDVYAWQGAGQATGSLTGYVLDTQRNPVPSAVVSSTTGGYKGTTNSEGYFCITGVEPGVYDFTASRNGYASRTVRAQLVLPGKTRVLGFSLPTTLPDAPTGVTVEDPGIGGTLKISWNNPSSEFDHIHIYRSTDPSQLGVLVYDNATSAPVWDTTVSDGVKYRYTVRSVRAGVESTNNDYYYGIASGGVKHTAYSYYPGAVWGHWAADYGQTFVATKTGSIASASCTPGFGGGGATDLTFTIHAGGPGGAQIGPAVTKRAGGDSECTATWNVGQVPVEAGQTYYLRVRGSGGFAAYRGGNVYPQGCFYINGTAQTTSDMWSTINIVESKSVLISDIGISETLPGNWQFVWKTNAPSTSQVEYGISEAYGSFSTYDQTLVTSHSINVTNLLPNTRYHFRVRSSHPGLPDAVSLDYVFTTGSPSIAQAKEYPDGTIVQLQGKVVTVGTDRFSGQFYVEDPYRTSGIRVAVGSSGISVREGNLVNVTGTITTSYGERQITNPSATVIETEVSVTDPLSMLTRDVGGAALNTYTPGVLGGVGVHNTGLLVRIWGRVLQVNTDSKFFYVDDGSGLSDGMGRIGLRVSCGGLAAGNSITLPPVGSYVQVTGISTKQLSGGNLIPVVRPRSQSDIIVY